MNTKILVISDLKLQQNKDFINFIITSINNEIESQLQNGNKTIVVCPGDLDIGINGLDFLKKINSEVIYVCGNNEFWGNDYNSLKKSLKENAPENVHFLDNQIVILNGYLFIGSTLWTDLGNKLNPDLLPMTANVMNDYIYIKHSTWHENLNEEKIELIKKIYPFQFDKILDNKSWNVIAQQDENSKALTFLHNFMLVFEYMLKVEEKYKLINKKDINFSTMENDFDSKYKEKSFKKWYEKTVDHVIPKYNQKRIIFSDELDYIFNILKEHDQLNMLKPIFVSHHLPFIEERLIAYNDSYGNEQKLLNELPDFPYKVRSGLNYAHHNYFYRIGKGDYDKNTAITQAIHYSNDGSANFPLKFNEIIYAFIHGHDNSYHYEDMIMGAKIITNPASQILPIFENKDGIVGLNVDYKKYHQITKDNEKNEVDELQKQLLSIPNFDLSRKELKEAAEIYCLKHFSWEQYTFYIDYLINLNNKIFQLLLKNPQWKDDIKNSDYINLKILTDAMDSSLSKMYDMENKLSEAYTIRISPTYSFNNKYYGILEYENIYLRKNHELTKLQDFFPTTLSWGHNFYLQHSYYNKELLKNDKKNILKLRDLIKNIPITHFREIDSQIIQNYNLLTSPIFNKKGLHKNDLMEKLNTIQEKNNLIDKNYFNF